MDIGNQLKKYRKENELSQEELAEKIFVSRQTISNWENDKNYPDIKSLALLSNLYNISIDNLVKGDVDTMKEIIDNNDIKKFKKESKILLIALTIFVILPIPINMFLGDVGMLIWFALSFFIVYYALRVEKLQKSYNIGTYKEIIAFLNGDTLDEVEKSREQGKYVYEKILFPLIGGIYGAIYGATIFMSTSTILKAVMTIGLLLYIIFNYKKLKL